MAGFFSKGGALDTISNYIPGVSNVKGAIEGDPAQAVFGPFGAAGEAAVGAVKGAVAPDINIPGLGATTPDPNIQTYQIDPSVAANYAAIRNNSYTPQTVAPGSSVSGVVDQNAITVPNVTGTVAANTNTNQDVAAQDWARQQQAAEGARLSGTVLGQPTAAMQDNAALLGQTQNFVRSAASTARGGSDQRLAAQQQAMGQVGELGQGNIATAGALAANEQANARAQLSSILSGAGTQDLAFQGAAYGIANGNAVRGTQADVGNQGAQTAAGLGNQTAAVQGAGVDQGAALLANQSNNAAQIQAYRDEVARRQMAMQGNIAAGAMQQGAAGQAQQAQIAAQRLQQQQQQLQLQTAIAKSTRNTKMLGGVIGSVGQVAGSVLGK